MSMSEKYLSPDAKGRICLGKLAKNITQFQLIIAEDGCITLKPMVAVLANEAWLFDNVEALKSVQRGLKQAGKGEFINRGSFAKFIEEE